MIRLIPEVHADILLMSFEDAEAVIKHVSKTLDEIRDYIEGRDKLTFPIYGDPYLVGLRAVFE